MSPVDQPYQCSICRRRYRTAAGLIAHRANPQLCANPLAYRVPWLVPVVPRQPVTEDH